MILFLILFLFILLAFPYFVLISQEVWDCMVTYSTMFTLLFVRVICLERLSVAFLVRQQRDYMVSFGKVDLLVILEGDNTKI